MPDDGYTTGTGTTEPRPEERRPIGPRYRRDRTWREEEGDWVAPVRRVSWGAIFAGTVVAAITWIMLSMLGTAFVLWSIDPATEQEPFSGVGAGATIWWVLTTLAALFFGGWVAGRLAGIPRRLDGMLQGLVTWGVVSLLGLWFLTSTAGQILGGVFNVVGTGLGLVGQGLGAAATAAGQAVGPVDEQAIADQVQQFLRQTGDPQLQPGAIEEELQAAGQTVTEAAQEAAVQPGQAGEAVSDALEQLAARGQAVISEVDRQDAINVITAQTELTEQQAANLVDNWIATWQRVQGQVQEVAQDVGPTALRVSEDVTDAVGTGTFWGFIALLIGGLAAVLGGAVGAPRNVPVSQTPGRRSEVIEEH